MNILRNKSQFIKVSTSKNFINFGNRFSHYVKGIVFKFLYYLDFPHDAIKITMPDGAVKEGISFETSPFTIATGISK